jgi:hypothetical protein
MANQRKLSPAISLAQLRENDTSFHDGQRIERITPGNYGTRPRAVSLAYSDTSDDRNSSIGMNSNLKHISAISMAYSDTDQQSSAGYLNQGPQFGGRRISSNSLALSDTTNRKSSFGGDSQQTRIVSGVSNLSTHRLIAENDPVQRAVNHLDQLWTPLSLRISTLVAISVLFAVFIVAMEILALFSRRNNGFPVPSIPPLWTYIPVALVFIQAAFWAQMEYRTKCLTPWRVLADGPSSASRSLLLDYISPWNIVSFLSSLASRHYGVSLAVFGSFVLKMLIISSTGLLAPESLMTVRNRSIELSTGFGSRAFNINAVTASDALMGIANTKGQFQQPGINGSWAYETLRPLDPSLGMWSKFRPQVSIQIVNYVQRL